MHKTIAATILTVIAFLVVPAGISAAFTETIRVGDGIIYIDNDGNEPNAPAVDVSMPCPQIMPEMRPALVFIESQMLEQHLYVTAFQGGAVRRQEIVAAKQIEATQLDHGIFLVTTSGELADRGTFVIDLDRGVGRQLGRSTRIDCLRSVPERGKAMLVYCALGLGEVRYLELDLVTLSLILSRTFKESELGDKFTGTYGGTSLSPDFGRVAYMVCHTSWGLQWSYDYRLMLMNLSTMQESCLDECVGIQVPPMSSTTEGWVPPLDWIDEQQIVYCHMPADANDRNWLSLVEPLYVFRRADAVAGQTVELRQARGDWRTVNGPLKLNRLNGELNYGSQWTLDPNDGTLTSSIVPYSIVQEHQPARAKVSLGEQILQAINGTIWSGLISARHKHLAWVVHVTDAEPGYTMYVKVDDIAGPIETAKGIYTTTPCGWVE
jgi:hypothetical protein